MRNRFMFWWRYLTRNIPWDTGIVPPEIAALVDSLPGGRALDLGCGTGTSALYLAARGWQVTGVDFVPQAIRQARRRAWREHLNVDFYVADVTRLGFLTGPFDVAYDVGCFHSLERGQRAAYVRELARLLRPEAPFALYAFMPRLLGGRLIGLTTDEVQQQFSPDFVVDRVVVGQDKGIGPASGWYFLRRESPRS